MSFKERVQDYAAELDETQKKEFVNKMIAIAGTAKAKEMTEEAKQRIIDELLP